MKKKNRGILLSIIGLVGLIIITIGISYAFLNYTKEGTKENIVNTGKLTFLYTEIDKVGAGISISDALPMSDSQGKQLIGIQNVFDFKITSDTLPTINIPYEITARMNKNSTLPEDAVKVYLTEVNGINEEKILLENYANLKQTSRIEESKYIEKTIYQGRVLRNSSNYEKNFRLRIWIDEKADFTTGEYNNKTFTLTVNVYSEAIVVTESDIELEGNTQVEKVLVGGEELIKIEGKDYQYETYFPEDTTNTDIKVTTKNPLASIKINKSEENDGGIYTLVSGENMFEVTITSEDKNRTDSFKIKVTVLKIGDNWSFNYLGSEEIWKIPVTGKYKLETWGAQGGSYTQTYHGGYGGYSKGTIFLNRHTNLYVNVGGAGTFSTGTNPGGYNGGGGTKGARDLASGSGGGATHIATSSGILSSLQSHISDILIVAGGGGGSCHWYNNSKTNYSYGRGGSGGGASGGTGYTVYKLNSSSFGGNGTGGSQTAGGTGGTAKISWGRASSGNFGLGGGSTSITSTGGGGGYYGGGAGSDVGAGGGSGYIGNANLTDKIMYCYGCTKTTEISTRTEPTNSVSSNPIEETSKMGNGYAKITYLGK